MEINNNYQPMAVVLEENNNHFTNDDVFNNSFTIGLFEIGDLLSCLFSWFCCPCAIAKSRTNIDDSEFCFNFWCISLPPLRWLIRSAYNIGDLSGEFGHEDCLYSLFCPCCTVNQLYQTTRLHRNPSRDGGRAFNTSDFSTQANEFNCFRFSYAFFCMQCSVGTVLSESVGMPWCLGCCCMNIFSARNILRYQYRLRLDSTSSSETNEECCLPYLFYMGASCASACCPLCSICIYGLLYVRLVILSNQLQGETKLKGCGDQKKYLFSRLPIQPVAAVVEMPQVYMLQSSDMVIERQPNFSTSTDKVHPM